MGQVETSKSFYQAFTDEKAMRSKIQALDIWTGTPVICITISPNDINNPALHLQTPRLRHRKEPVGPSSGACRFKAPWKMVEETAFTEDGLLKIHRNHPLVNPYNKAMAIGLGHNHDISIILTRTKG